MILILGAFHVSSQKENATNANSGSVVVSKSPSQLDIETRDSDGDGTPDWEELLKDKAFKSVTATSSASFTPSDTYVPPTTLTGKFSEAFLQDYLEGKMHGEDFSDPTQFIDGAIRTIDANTASKKHTRAELNIIPADETSIREYGNEIVTIMNRHSKKSESELAILGRAIETNNPDVLNDLAPIQIGYENITADTLHIEVPSELALQHVNLLNAYEAVTFDIQAMQLAFSDPLYALARIRLYPEDVNNLVLVLKEIAGTLDAQGIVYTKDEPGAFFYIFDAT